MGALYRGTLSQTIANLAGKMDQRFHGFEKEVEDWHWWYRVRREILDQQLASLQLPERARLLDVGCGTGGASLVLSRYGDAVALDRAPESFRLSLDRPYRHRVVGSADQPLPFADQSFDVVCALDILEHLDDDAACTRELYRVCKRGGVAIVFVPAFQMLWGYNDDYSHHRRRYTRPQLEALLHRAGFSVEAAGYFNMILFLPTLAARVAQRMLPQLDQMEHSTRPHPMHRLLAALFRLELPILKRARLPVGTSAFAIARRVQA
jgi:SAM-dependent methyltransferase